MQSSNRPPSASASLAATKAFLRDRESNGALSSAAAAAALRTHTTTPTPVADTVTKRMVRKASMSSQGSGSQQRPALRRHSSSGSMTERSFRAPSPARTSPVDGDAPPVPKVPDQVPQVSVVHRRNSSLEPPARGGSPVGRGGGRGVSLDRGTSHAAQHGRGQPRSSPLSRVVEDDQDAGQRSSVNFSRPISPPAMPSPTLRTAAPARAGQGGWFAGPVVNTEQTFRGEQTRPKTSEAMSAHAPQAHISSPARQPAPKRTTQPSHGHGVEGARLAAGSMRAKPSGTSVQAQPTHTAAKDRPVRIVDPNSPYAVYDPSSRKFIHKQDAMNLHRAMSDAEEPAPPYEPQPMVYQSHQETQRYIQPTSQPAQNRNTVGRSASVSPVREAPQLVPVISQARRTFSPTRNDAHGVAISHDEPVTYTTQNHAEAESRLSAGANTGRKLESAPEHTEETDQVLSPKFSSNQDNPYPLLAPTLAPPSSGPPSTQGSARSTRTHSLSPPRNAHFAAVAAVEFPDGVKHQPPNRSVSPAKSALKASPSVSRRSHSPLANDGRLITRGPLSEASDAVSEDGGKKKKKVRISFEEEPVIVGTSAYAGADGSNLAANYESADEEEDFDDLMKPRPVLPSFGSIRDQNRRARDEDIPEKVTETVSSSLSNSATLMGESQEMSSDHKVGGILANDFAAKQAISARPSDPLPPEVTTVEGSGYWSDSDKSEDPRTVSDTQFEPQKMDALQSTPEPEPKTLTHRIEPRPVPLDVPIIAVQPASPPLPRESAAEPILFPTPTPASRSTTTQDRRSFVPGGWDDDDVSEPEIEPKKPDSVVSAPQAPSTPSNPSITIQIPERPVDDDSSDDNSSVYSDAYEEIDEGEGFGSIDAIMESPVQPGSSRFTSSTPSPIEQRTHKTGLENSNWAPTNAQDPNQQNDETNTDWEKSQLHWSEVSDSRKQKPPQGLLINTLGMSGEPKATPQPAAPIGKAKSEPKHTVQGGPAPTPKSTQPQERKVKVDPSVGRTQPAPQPANSPAQPRKSALKKTTASSPSTDPSFKKTMRDRAPATNGSESQMRTTLRGANGGSAGRGSSAPAAHRQSLPPPDTRPPRGALQKKHLPTAAAGTAAKPRPQSSAGIPLIKTKPIYQAPAYESDSDASVSSFQRERQRNRASRQSNGTYTMRTSMRSGPTPTMRAAPPVRSISPPRIATPTAQSTLRKSMRPSSPTPDSPKGVKSSRFSIRSLSPAGRFRRSSYDVAPPMPSLPVQGASIQAPLPKKKTMFGKQPASKAPAKAPKPFKSRFNDSSDEDEGGPRTFQSRFADSDSEDDDFELPQGLTPVRGIPKRPGEEDGDSTDLEDEASDNEPSPVLVTNGADKSKTNGTNGSSQAQGSSLAAGSLRKQELPSSDSSKKAKRGFFGFGKKKTSYLADADAQADPSTDIPMPPAQQNRDRNRPLTPIGEDRDLAAGEATTKAPTAGRRTMAERSASDSWPLPSPNPAFAEQQRPQSADGPVQRKGSHRPTLVKRHSSQISQARTEVDVRSGKAVSFGKTGKKKKFQGLRRVFGLND